MLGLFSRLSAFIVSAQKSEMSDWFGLSESHPING